jgi:hypothetical protein
VILARRAIVEILGRRPIVRWRSAALAGATPKTSQIRFEQFGKLGFVALKKLPAAIFLERFSQAPGRRLQAFQGDVLDIAKEALSEGLLLPEQEAGQCHAAERGKGQEKALP